MLKIYFLLISYLVFLFFNFPIMSDVQGHSLAHLERFYHIENNTLTNFQGEQFSKINYKDLLHEDLCFLLRDPEQALIIHDAYTEYILHSLPSEFLQSFSKALLKVCVLFGAPHFSPETALLAFFKEENEAFRKWATDNQKAISQFVAKANVSARPPISCKDNSPISTVVILTTSASGGNLSVANAISSYLTKSKDMRTIIIDSEFVGRKTDLVMLATGETTYDGIYAKYFQQGNGGLDFITTRDAISKQIGQYIPSRFGLELKEQVRMCNPDLIVSTRNYCIDDIPLCTLGVPFAMVHCDYELALYLLDLYGIAKPEMITYFLPVWESRVFRPIFEHKNLMQLYNENDSKETLLTKLSSVLEQPQEAITEQYRLLGYPVCPEFYRIQDPDLLEKIKQKWEIPTEDFPILISLGKNGVGALENIFEELLVSPKGKFSKKYIFVCGKNMELKDHLQSKLEMAGEYSNSFKICGLLDPEEMNQLMNICPVYLSKPGGAVTSEAMETGTYMLMVCTHPWEEANGSVLEKNDLGKKRREAVALVPQIDECIEKVLNSANKLKENISWKERLSEWIDQRL